MNSRQRYNYSRLIYIINKLNLKYAFFTNGEYISLKHFLFGYSLIK